MKSTSLVALAIGLSALLSHGQTVPAAINYQGRVTDSTGTGLGTGTPVNRVMIFRLYGTATGGNPIWSEQQTVTLADGEFSVLLGTGIEASFGDTARPSLLNAFAGSDRFLEIVVDNGDGTLNAADVPIAPRQRLTSTAYALRAATADSVASGTDLNLRDANHGLGWYGIGRPFNGQDIDGPVLYGFSGGALGSSQDGTQNTALRWDATGNVGIGTAARSDTKLAISGALGLFDGATRSKNAGISTEYGGELVQIGVNEDSGNRFGGNYDSSTQGGLFRIDSANGYNLFSFLGRPGNSTAAASPLMIINSDGKVGIGTTNPSQTLDVAGSIRVGNGATATPNNSPSGGAGSRLIMWPGSDTETPFGFGISDSTLWSSVPASATFRWFGGTTERMNLNGNTGTLSVTGDLTAKSLVSGTYSTHSNSFISVRSAGGNQFMSGINLKHFSDSYGFSLYSDERTVNGYGFHVTSAFGGAATSRLFIDAMSGNVGIGNFTPSAKLDVSGNIKANGKPVPVGEEDLRIVRGTVTNPYSLPSGTTYTSPNNYIFNTNQTLVLKGAGYSLLKISTGRYRITFTNAFTDSPSFTFTPEGSVGGERVFTKVTSKSTNVIEIQVINDDSDFGNDIGFSFIAIGPR